MWQNRGIGNEIKTSKRSEQIVELIDIIVSAAFLSLLNDVTTDAENINPLKTKRICFI
jgi:hypothetical protein